MDHTPFPDRIDIKPDQQLVSQQIILKILKFLYFRVHVLLSEQVHQSTSYQPLSHSYHIASVVILFDGSSLDWRVMAYFCCRNCRLCCCRNCRLFVVVCKIGRCFGGWINGFLRKLLIHMAEFCK